MCTLCSHCKNCRALGKLDAESKKHRSINCPYKALSLVQPVMPLAELSGITPDDDDDEEAASAAAAKTNESSDDGIISSESSEDEPVVTMANRDRRRKSINISESEGSDSEGESVLSSPRKNKGRKQSFSKQKAGGKGKAPMKETTARPASKRPRRGGQ